MIRHLERLVADPAQGVAMGVRTQAVAARRRLPAANATALLPLLEQAIAARPLIAARQRCFPFSCLIYPMPISGGLSIHFTLDLAGAFQGRQTLALPLWSQALGEPQAAQVFVARRLRPPGALSRDRI